MHQRSLRVLAFTLLAFVSACATGSSEKGPDGTIAYYVSIETSDPDVRIETNEDYMGKAPLTLKIWGDKDGTFHNFGSSDYVIKAIPANTNLTTQYKVFRTGGWFSQEDRIPKALFFDMKNKSGISPAAPRY